MKRLNMQLWVVFPSSVAALSVVFTTTTVVQNLPLGANALAVASVPRWNDDRRVVDDDYHDRDQGKGKGRWGEKREQSSDTSTTRSSSSSSHTQPLDVRIRTTTVEDLGGIADMLAHALMDKKEDDRYDHPQIYNFKRRMEYLRLRAGVVTFLQSRFDAIQAGHDAAAAAATTLTKTRAASNDHAHNVSWTDLSEADQLRALWSKDTFRRKLEKAARLSGESHLWKSHNFACAPDHAGWLCHKMMTAENAVNGDVVGFCEMAMLQQPSASPPQLPSDDTGTMTTSTSATHTQPVPTIANLITSPDYRRRGIGSKLLSSATRYLRHGLWPTTTPTSKVSGGNSHGEHESTTKLALFVEEHNTRAIRMYESLGFEKKQRLERDAHVQSQWYMSKRICQGRTVNMPTLMKS